MRKALYSVLFVLSLTAAARAFAHHSFAAEFDGRRTFVISGVLTKVVWTNPHILLWVDVTDENGKVIPYSITTGPPGTLRRAGVKKSDFEVGEKVSITGAPAKDGSAHGWLKMIKYPDGRVFVYRDGSE
jgi:hypothetical protein